MQTGMQTLAVDTTKSMLISVSAAKWYVLHVKNGTRFVPRPVSSTSKYSDLVSDRKCLHGCSLKKRNNAVDHEFHR